MPEQFKSKGKFLYECTICGEAVESGVMNIMNHKERCKGVESNIRLDNLKKIEEINIIAISEILVDNRSPVYHIFAQRKLVAQKFCASEINKETYIEVIEACNREIMKYMRIW